MANSKKSLLLILQKPINSPQFSLKIRPLHKEEYSEVPYNDKLPFRLKNGQDVEISQLFTILIENFKENPVLDFKAELLLTDGEVTLLRLNLLNLFEIPEVVANFRQLEVFSCRHNYLEELPPFIYTLTELRSLDIAGNEIDEIPAEISRLQKLRYLNVDLNPLVMLPAELDDMPELAVIEIEKPLSCEIRLQNNLQHVFTNNNNLILQFLAFTGPILNLDALLDVEEIEIDLEELNYFLMQFFPFTGELLDLDPYLPGVIQRVAPNELKVFLQLRNAGLITSFQTIFRYWDRGKHSWQIDDGTSVMSEEEYNQFEEDSAYEGRPVMMLSMENKNLVNIPKIIMEFEELRLLNVSNNKIQKLPVWLLRHPTLEGIIIKNNKIRAQDISSNFYHQFEIVIKKDQMFWKEEEDDEDEYQDPDGFYNEEDFDYELGKQTAYEDFQGAIDVDEDEDDYYIIEDEDEDDESEANQGGTF